MIRAILVVGWVGLLLVGVAAASGYFVGGEEATQLHLVLALFATGAVLFADLCVLVYLPATVRIVRRTSRELGLAPRWAQDQVRGARRSVVLAGASAVALVAMFSSGFPVYAGAWGAWVHHSLFAVGVGLELTFLLVAARDLASCEQRLAAFGREAEVAGGR